MKNTNNSVKKHQSYGILLLALLFSCSVSAKVSHYVGGYAQLGEWSLLPTNSKYGNSVGVAGGAGVLYELQSGPTYKSVRFLLDVGVGAVGGMTAYIQTSNAQVVLENQPDPNGDRFDYNYDIRDRKDQYNNIALHFPLMVGVQYKRFYALAGVRFYANVWTQRMTTATLTTYGSYWDKASNKQIFDDFRDMPEYQFFTDEPLKNSQQTYFKLDADLSLEIGARLGVINYSVGYDVPKRKLEYRLGAFMDYGLFDVHTSGNMQALKLPDSYNYVEAYGKRTMIDAVEFNDVMRTKSFAKKVQNLMVGVKFTLLFQMPEQKKCVMCTDGYKSSARRGGSRRGMQYEE
jgi:hypothetical protein